MGRAMLTTAEVLAKLGDWLSPGELAEVLKKLLRVPEAWEVLHNPNFIEHVLDHDAEEKLLPASLAKLVLKDSGDTELDESEHEFELLVEELWKENERRAVAGRDFEEVAILSNKLQPLLASPRYPEILSQLCMDAEAWKSPLACTWLELENGEEFLASLIGENTPFGFILVLNTLLANYSKEEALPLLLQASQSLPRYETLDLMIAHEPAFLEYIVAIDQETQTQIFEDPSKASPDTNLTLSILAHLREEEDLATAYVNQAADLQLALRARLEDQKAQLHQSSGAIEMALEAHHQALALVNSPERRAELSLFHLQQDNSSEAIQVLPAEPVTLAERIAASKALFRQDESEKAHHYLQQAVEQIQSSPTPDYEWVTRLVDLLRTHGDILSAIKVAKIQASTFPGNVDGLVELADLLNAAGDATIAADYASLAFALSPNSTLTRQTLATSLQQSGNPTGALAHWTALADENPLALSHVAQCALEAGFLDLAISMARNYNEIEPQSAAGQVLLGRALTENQEFDEAYSVLEKATQEFPDHADTWIALSECQIQSNDLEAAGHTLSTAIQLIPGNPELLHAYSAWLEGQGRHSEAVEAAENAYQSEPKSYKYQVAYGDLLRQLGHLEEALTILKPAIKQKPFHWKGLQAIAKTYEGLQDLSSACYSISNLPDTVPGDVHLYAAKISLQLAQENEDPNALRSGKSHLEQAKAEGLIDPTIHYYQGLFEELQGNHQEAKDHYHTSAKSFLNKDPEVYLDSKLGIARTALALEQIPEATSTLEEARLRYPASIHVLTLLSKTYLESGNEIEALKTIERALKIEPSNRYALKQIAQISSQLKTWAPAMHAFKKSVDLNPENPKAWIDFSENALTVGNLSEARKALSQALSLDRQDPHVLACAAKVMHQLDRPQSAQRLLRRAIHQNNDSVPLLRQLALAAEDSGEHEIALQAWERVSELEPQDKQASLNSARAYWATGDQLNAIKLWERNLKHDPADIPTLTALANAYASQGKVDDGLALFDNALQIQPHHVELALQAAQFALDIHDVDTAFDVLSSILRHAPKDSDVLLTLADCLIQRKMPQKALEVLESVIVEESFPVRWFALVTIASAMLGDLSRAKSSFEQACQHTHLKDRDILLFSKAALTIHRWSDAIKFLTQKTGAYENTIRCLAEAQVRIRASEVNLLYLEAQAHNHAPLTFLNPENQPEQIQKLLEKASTSPIYKNLYDRFSYRFNLLTYVGDPTPLLKNTIYAEKDKTGETLEAMALARLRRGQPREALNLIALRDDYELEGDLFDLIVGICQVKLDRLELARDVFQIAQGNPLIQPLGQFFEAQTLVEESKLQEKKSLLNAAIANWPEEYAWHYQLGTLYLQEEDLDSALPHLQHAAELSPESDLYNLTLARVLRDTGHLSQGYARLNLAAKKAPSDLKIRYEAGSLALAIGVPEDAEVHFKQACSLSPSDSSCLVGSARAAMALGKSKEAMEIIRSALRISPEDPETLIAAGEIFAKQGKFDKAISSYELALTKASDPLPVHLAHIKLLSQAGRNEDAIEQTRQFIKEFPEDERIWAAHAEACEASEEFQQAQEAVNKAVKLAPNNITYRLILGRISRKAGQLDRALDELSRIEKMEPTNTRILVELGRLFEDRRQLTEALETYHRAISSDPQFAKAYYRAGLVLKNLKSYPEAGAMLGKAAELDPNNPETHHQLAAVRALELVHGGIPQAVVSQ